MLIGIMGQVNDAYLALVILTQGLTQHAKQRPQTGAGGHQPQRPGVPVRVVVQRPAA
ncbi:hypothetical protein D3C86_1522790 [compost metagenome]